MESMRGIYLTVATFVNYVMLTFTNYSTGILVEIPSVPPDPLVGTGDQLSELIKLVISLAGGLLSTLVIAFLKKRYPNMFDFAVKDKPNMGQR
jgi:hypothetical protein